MTVIGHGWDDNVGAPAFRNLVTNGAMQVAQRGTSTAGISAVTSNGYYTADRFELYTDTAGTWTQSVVAEAPTGQGFNKSLKMLCTTANASLSAGSLCQIRTKFESQDLQRIKKGTSSAMPLTVSFWVRANVTGTYVVGMYDYTNIRLVAAQYTISASGVWEKKTVTFPADTTGVLNNDNALSLQLHFRLAAGSTFSSGTLQTSWGTDVPANSSVGQTNLASAINNYWQITGVQLESGSVATPFEFEPFETTLRKCQRYFQKCTPYSQTNFTTLASDSNMSLGKCWITTGSGGGGIRIIFPVEMRAIPSVDITSWTSTNTAVSDGGTITTHSPGIGDTTSILETKSPTGLSIYSTSVEYKMFFFWRASAEL